MKTQGFKFIQGGMQLPLQGSTTGKYPTTGSASTGSLCWDRPVGSTSTMKLRGLEVPSLLLQLESRVRVERQVWASQSSKARQGGQPSATQRESWGYEGHYSKAGCGRKGVKEIKAMKLQDRSTQSCTRSGAFSLFFIIKNDMSWKCFKSQNSP